MLTTAVHLCLVSIAPAAHAHSLTHSLTHSSLTHELTPTTATTTIITTTTTTSTTITTAAAAITTTTIAIQTAARISIRLHHWVDRLLDVRVCIWSVASAREV